MKKFRPAKVLNKWVVWNENQVKLEIFEFIYIHYFQSKETSDNILQMLFESSTTIIFFKLCS